MTIQEAAIALDLSRDAINRLVEEGHLVLTNESVRAYRTRQGFRQLFLITGDVKYLKVM